MFSLARQSRCDSHRTKEFRKAGGRGSPSLLALVLNSENKPEFSEKINYRHGIKLDLIKIMIHFKVVQNFSLILVEREKIYEVNKNKRVASNSVYLFWNHLNG